MNRIARPIIVFAASLFLAISPVAQDATVPLPLARPDPATRVAETAPMQETSEETDVAETAGTAQTAQGDAVRLPRSRPDTGSGQTRSAARNDTAQNGASSAQTTQSQGDEADTATPAPARIYQVACPAVLSGLVDGELIDPISDGACGTQSPYRITAVRVGTQTVDLSAPIIVNCEMATEFAKWIARISAYTESIFNEPVTAVRTGTSYMCRQRNNGRGIFVSEHGFANAIDVTGFVIGDGRRIELPANWAGDAPEARTMRFAHDTACGNFTTVLGPDANALHADHLHIDLGCHGRGCTARLCE